MPTNSFRLGVAQITSGDQIDINLQTVEKLYAKAAADQAELVVFPENSLYFRIRSGEAVQGLAWNGTEMTRLQKLVDATGVHLMLTTALVEGGAKLSNSTLRFSPGVAAEKLYSKVHLFDVDVEGAPPVR